MNENILNTRSKILSAAIELFGSEGDLTIRELTDRAGVNVASINYYFGSKNNLLKEVEEYYAELLYKMQNEIIENKDEYPKNKLVNWVNSLIEFMLKYPALITLVTSLVSQEKNYNPMLVQKFFLNEDSKKIIEKIISDITKITDKNILSYKYIQIFSGILGPILFRTISSVYGKNAILFNIDNQDERIKYAELLVDSILTS